MTYIYKGPLEERDGDFKVTDGLITGATNINWDDAFDKRVDTWTFPLLYSGNVASISLTDSGIDHGGLSGLGDVDDHLLYLDLAGTRPMTGDLDMDCNAIGDAKWIQFDIDFEDGSAEGRLQWNKDDGVLEFGNPGGNVNLQIGQEMQVRVTNDTITPITNGTPVYLSGATGTNITIAPADADFDLGLGFRTFAVATEDIAGNNGKGYVTTQGFVRDIDTSFAAAVGTPAYLAVGGGFTSTPPSAPDITYLVGIVTRKSATVGEIYVSQRSLPNFNSLSDVDPTLLADGSIPQWDLASDTWKTTTTPSAPAEGIFGHWSRDDGTSLLTPAVAGDKILTTASITGQKFISTAGSGISAFVFGEAGGDTNLTWAATGALDFVHMSVNNAIVQTWANDGSGVLSSNIFGNLTIDLQSVSTDAILTMDGSSDAPGTLRYESDNEVFIFDKDLNVGGNLDVTGTGTFSSTLTANGDFTNGAVTLAQGIGTWQIEVDNINAWRVRVAGDEYFRIDTTTGTENITLGNTTTNPAINIPGTGLVTIGGNLLLPDEGYIGAGTATTLVQLDQDLGVIINDDLEVAGIIEIPTTTSTVGQITQNGSRFFHSYGTDNVFIGENAGNFSLTVANAVDNVAIGRLALDALTTGAQNFGLGSLSLTSLNTGGNNVGIGKSSLQSATSAISNIGIGRSALIAITTGRSNVAIGTFAGLGLTGNDSGCVLIGNNAGFYETVGNTLIIDNDRGADEATSRERALLYGLFENHASGPWLSVNGAFQVGNSTTARTSLLTGNVRIGDTTTPTKELELNGRLVMVPSDLTITAAGGIVPVKSEHGIVGDAAPIIVTANPQIEAGSAGQILILEGRSDTNTVTLDDGNGLHLHGKAVMGNHDILSLRYDGVNSEWTEVSRNFAASEKAWSFASPVGSSGTFYTGGYYLFGASNFTPAGGQTLGAANKSYAAHAFIVIGAASTDMVVRVTGTSIDDDGVRTASDTEDLDTSAGSTNDYFETGKKWIGQISYTLLSGTGVTVNYGFAKYWDNNNNDFRIVGIEVTGRAGANDTTPNISLIHHKATGWTYNGGAPPTPPAATANMNTDHVTEIQYAIGENFAWKRSNLTDNVMGGSSEGTIIQWDTNANKSVDIAHVLLRVRGN